MKELELFGSATRDDFSPDSDIDVLVTFEGREQLFARYFDLKEGFKNKSLAGASMLSCQKRSQTQCCREHVDKERTVVYGA